MDRNYYNTKKIPWCIQNMKYGICRFIFLSQLKCLEQIAQIKPYNKTTESECEFESIFFLFSGKTTF